MSLDTRNRRIGPWDSLGEIVNSINDLENTNVKCTWFESVASGTSGTITPPTGGTILLDEWSQGVDVLVSGISSGIPTFASVVDTEGAIITGTLDAAGAWTISGTPGDGYPISLIFVYRVALSDFNQAYCLESATIEGVNTLSLLGDLGNELTGFPDDYRTQSTIAFDNTTRTFTITPVGDKFSVWVLGKEFIYTTAETQVIPDTEGIHWIYFDSDGAIQVVSNPTEAQEEAAIKRNALIAYILWDATNNLSTIFADERHGLTMDGSTHFYLHETVGFAYYEGLAAGDIVADGSGASDLTAQLSITDGTLFDEDIKHETSGSGQTLSLPAQIPVFYIEGVAGTWRKDAADNFPVKNFVGGSSLLAYNSYSAPNYGQTEIGNNNYVLCHIFAVNDIDEPIVAIQGQAEYNTIGQARLGSETELANLNLTGAPAQEYTPLYTLIFQTSTTYSNTPLARIRTTDLGFDYVDWRNVIISGGGTAGTGDVVGPSSSTDNAIARFDQATGKVIQNSTTILDDSGNIKFPDATGLLDAAGNTAIKINSGGSSDFYFNGTLTAKTKSGGMVVYDEIIAMGSQPGMLLKSAADVAFADMYSIGSDFVFKNYIDGGLITFEGDHVSDGSQAFVFKGDPDGSVDLYHAGLQTFRTNESGISVYDSDGDDPLVGFYSSGGTTQGYIQFSDGDVKIVDSINNDVMFKVNANGATELYNNGTKIFSTNSAGFEVFTGSDRKITLNGTNGFIQILGSTLGGWVNYLTFTSSAGADTFHYGAFGNQDTITNGYIGRSYTDTCAKFFMDAEVALYHNGSLRFNTTAIGMTVSGHGGMDVDIYDAGTGNCQIVNNLDDKYILLRGHTGGNPHNLIVAYPQSHVEILYNGHSSLLTTNTGIQIKEVGGESCYLFVEADGDVVLQGSKAGREVSIKALDAAGTAYATLFKGWPDSNVALYFNDAIAFKTQANGINIYDSNSSGTLPGLSFYNEGSGSNSGQIYSSAGSITIQTQSTAGKTIKLRGYNGAAGETMLLATENSSVDLYYDGNAVLKTHTTGIVIGSALEGTLSHNGTDMYFDNDQNGGDLYLRVNDGGTETAVKCNSAGSVDLYHNNSLSMGTTTAGIVIRPGSSDIKVVTGSGSPESVVSANIGSIYFRTDGGAGTSLYVKETGSSSTGWVGK